jgi:multiple sugar transport system permease protein
MAAATISVLPTVALVLILQRHLVKGIALSGLGGR